MAGKKEMEEGQPGARLVEAGVGFVVEPDEEIDDVALDDVELDDVALDDVELDDAILDAKELDDVALAAVSCA